MKRLLVVNPRFALPTAMLALALMGRAAFADSPDCSPKRAEQIRRWAQSLDPRAGEQGPSFVEKCTYARSELLLWMTHYYDVRGEYDRAHQLAEKVPPAGSEASDRDRVLGNAARGDCKELEDRVHSRQPGYANDSEALLVLARAQARQRRFAEARTNYDAYLKLKPDDHDIEIEEDYTWLWEGDGPQAESRFGKIRSYSDLTPDQTAAVDAGIVRAGREGSDSRRPKPLAPPTLDAGPEVLTTTFFAFSRSSLHLAYQGEDLQGRIQTDWLSSDRPGMTSYGALEGVIGASHLFGDRVAVSGDIGAFETGHTVFLFQANGEYRFDQGATPYIGIYQDALAKDVPLPSALSGQARNAAYFGFRYRSYLDARIEARNYPSLTSSTYIFAKTAYPIRPVEGVGAAEGAITALLTAENEEFARGSTYVYSPKSDTAFKVGLEYSADFTDQISGSLDAFYGRLFESPNSDSGLTFGTTASLLSLSASVGYRISKDFAATVRMSFDRTTGDDGNTTYGSALFGVGLTWHLDGGSSL